MQKVMGFFWKVLEITFQKIELGLIEMNANEIMS